MRRKGKVSAFCPRSEAALACLSTVAYTILGESFGIRAKVDFSGRKDDRRGAKFLIPANAMHAALR